MLLTDYFKELQSQLPVEYSYDQSLLSLDDREDENLMLYLKNKALFFDHLGKCDLILLVAGFYDLKNNDYFVDFLMENDPGLQFDDDSSDMIPKVQISRKNFSVLGFQWQGLLTMYYKVITFNFLNFLYVFPYRYFLRVDVAHDNAWRRSTNQQRLKRYLYRCFGFGATYVGLSPHCSRTSFRST